MADVQAIREGLAANGAALKTPLNLIGQVSPHLLGNPSPVCLMVAGIEPDGYEYLTYGGGSTDPGMRFMFLIQVVLGDILKPISQKILNRLFAPTGAESLVSAIEADQHLTSRYREAGQGEYELVTGQAAAADSVSFAGWRGQTTWTPPGSTTELVSGTWAFEVFAS